MRVLLVTDWPAVDGGVETYLAATADGLRRAGDEVALLTSGIGSGREVADYVAWGSGRLPLRAVLQVWNPAAARAVRRAVADFQPAVAHVSMFEMALSPSVLSALAPVPAVLNIAYYKPICPTGLKLLPDRTLCGVPQGAVCMRNGCVGPAHWLRDRARYAAIGRALRRPAATVTCSGWMREQLARAGIHADWREWPVPSPSPGFRPRRAARPLFVFTGRLAPEKGVDVLLRAFAQVAETVDSGLRVVGDGPSRAPLERLTGELGITSRVEFTGRVAPAEVEARLVDAWALVAPSLWAEPLGLTAVEAVVRGVPVVASATGGLAEVVEQGATGLLVPNGDVGALAGALAAVASGEAFPGGAVDADAVERARRRHDLDRHVDWLRAIFAEVTA